MKTYLGIDVGGTAIKYALMTEESTILSKGEIATPKTNLEDFINAIVDIYNKHNEVSGIAMSAPGRIDANTGYMFTGGALSHYIMECPLAKLIMDKIPVLVTIDNDAKCAASAELWKGSLQNVSCGMVLTIGTGIGGGVVVDGKVHRGFNFASGEVSGLPTTIHPVNDPFDVWARINSTGNLVKAYAEVKHLNPKEVDGKHFFEAISHQDADAQRILEDFSQSFAMGLFTIQTILDTETIAIGGGISSQAILIETIQAKLEALFTSLTWAPQKMMKLVPCAFGNDSNLIGALYHHLNHGKD